MQHALAIRTDSTRFGNPVTDAYKSDAYIVIHSNAVEALEFFSPVKAAGWRLIGES